PNGILLRFTTSALNSKRFELFDFGIYNSGNITMVNETKTSIPWYGNYHRPEYEPTFAPQDSLHKHDLGFKAIENYVRQKNNMGLGLSIKLNDTTTMDYKFDFRIKNVKIWKITTSVNGATEKTKKDTALFKSISEENGWIWK
ncbi:MAG TPA: hypothetical protein VKF42_02475, partial [Chitinivibrionales bacterium]|nr:hypothetical protein [Chitinivibrionales bacterium]